MRVAVSFVQQLAIGAIFMLAVNPSLWESISVPHVAVKAIIFIIFGLLALDLFRNVYRDY